METTTLKLRGMSCAACASNIEAAIRSVPGVAICHVNFGAEQATVTYDRDETNLVAIQQVVDAAGYAAAPMQDDALALEDDAERRERQAKHRQLTRRVWVSAIANLVGCVATSKRTVTPIAYPVQTQLGIPQNLVNKSLQ